MSLVRTTCPRCDIVTLRAPDLTVRRTDGSSQAVFVCPDCEGEVTHPLNERMVPVLIGAGCPVEDLSIGGCMARHPSQGFEITELEIAEFVAGLDRANWYDELVD